MKWTVLIFFVVFMTALLGFSRIMCISANADSRYSNNHALSAKHELNQKQFYSEQALANDLGNSHTRYESATFSSGFTAFLNTPVIVTLLLTIACLGFALELFSPRFGIAGSIGLIAVLLYFYGHFAAGLAGFDVILLFIIGILLVAAEFFLPGAIAGILGIASILASLLLAGGDIKYTAISLLIALLVTLLGVIFMIKVLKKRMKLFKKIVLDDFASTEGGYVSNINRKDLLGKTGKTLTPLRPAGMMNIGEERLDVVSEGSFIPKDEWVSVIKVEGSRIVVRPLKKDENA
ncbi:NfeD family protein [Heyndrickxia acidicola]|uniref:NfeD family protein n=1 Tax=Heyndrickxia acidicola TaxID=209389 RepID=A0ABU6MK77_9BACI|nr:NfeD family protein [Heyndrickxia acidicola]MED1205088.1 NfeD family protein [Heyndrickxia acidicola]